MGKGVFVVCIGVLIACGGSEDTGGGEFDAAPPPECVDNSDCDDGNDCSFDFCDMGSCAHEADAELEGEECSDGDNCTTNDQCQAGACVGSAVDCSGLSDGCNTGVCNADTGECEAEVSADDTPCDDAVFCTENDVCTSGVCEGTARDCSTLDSDCTQGVCDEDTAACVSMNINEAGTCDDGLFCTTGETCTAGVCDGPATDCSSAADQCNTGTCDETAGACVGVPVGDGTLCNDGLFCTPTDQCVSGTCTGSGTIDCSGLDNQCNAGVCDDDIDSCATMPANEGGACDDGLFCQTGSTCSAGVCAGGSPTVCDDTDACTTNSCDEGGDTCVFTPVPPIPGAEGPPGDATCTDSVDNDCDGDVDLADASCVACVDDGDCDDGNACTTDTCTGLSVCDNTPVTDGSGCDDGLFCNTGETCTGGVCGGGAATDCSSLDGDCTVGTCSEGGDTCVASPANEGGGCDDGLFCTTGDTCASGVCGGGPRDCSGAGGPCLTASCDETGDTCVGTPVPNGTGCDIGFCTVGETCTGGVCGGGSARDCSDADACTSDSCDELGDTCVNPSLALDPDSNVFTSATGSVLDVCLVADSGARTVVWTDLVDTAGLPVPGASVTIGGATATESSARPGTYYIEYVAEAAPTTTMLSVVASACGDVETLTDVVTVTHEMANATEGGTGGCSPMHGNLRVQVVDEIGTPIAGASVIVGASETNAFETAPEALFGGVSSLATNVGTTDGSGFITFYDYAASLDGPVMTTAGAANRSYVTIDSGNASDLVLALPVIHPMVAGTSLYSNGDGNPTPPDCGDVDAAVVLPHLDIDVVGTFETSLLFGPNRCWDPGNTLVSDTPVAIPDNLWLPAQGPGGGLTCFFGQFDEAPWSITLDNTADTGVTEDLVMAAVDAPLADIQAVLSGGSIADILPVLEFNTIGFDLDINVAGNVSPNTIDLDDTYPNNFTATFAGAPVETDVVGIGAGDYDGTNGIGPLFLLGTDVRQFTSGGSQVSIPNSNLSSGSPSGIRRVAALTALYLDATDAAHTGAIAGLENGVSTIYVRDNGSSMSTAPFGPTGATVNLSVDFGLGAFLDLAQVTFTDPGSFEWDNVTNAGNVPLFSVHELTVVTHTYLPVISCATENDVRDSRTTHWIVYRPFNLACSGGTTECFDLPTLPSSFPRASTGTQKRPGLEQYVGSGNACGSCPVAGEACVDPDGGAGSAASMCMAGAGTAGNPYVTQEYEWLLHVYDLEVLTRGMTGIFDFNAFEFATRKLYMTHESTNRVNIN